MKATRQVALLFGMQFPVYKTYILMTSWDVEWILGWAFYSKEKQNADPKGFRNKVLSLANHLSPFTKQLLACWSGLW